MFTCTDRRCCLCSANYCRFVLISLLVWRDSLVPRDVSVIVVPVLCVTSTGSQDSWSCSVSASPDSILCFTLLAASRSCWACVQWQRVQCSRALQHSELHNTEKKVLFATCAAPVPRYARHDLSGYSVLSFPHSAGGSGAKGGGIAFVIRDSLKPHVATTSSFPVQHPCFETAQLTLTYNKQLTNLFCIDRPPPIKKNKFSDSMFFDQFFDFLEHSDSLPGTETLLIGDIKCHFENVENNNSRKLHDIIDTFNLT